MEISTEVTNVGFFVALRGSLEELSAEEVKKRLQHVFQQNTKHLLMDFTGVSKVTAAGLRNLLPYVQQIQEHKMELLLFNLNEDSHGLITNSGFDSLVKVFDSKSAAIGYINQKNLRNK